jgi:hypothetical protein
MDKQSPEDEALEVLLSLRAGQALTPDKASKVLSVSADEAIRAATNGVRRSRYRAVGETQVYWLTGSPGSGKTQALTQFVAQLPNLGGTDKFAFASVQLDQELQATTSGDLAHAIVSHTLAGHRLGGVEDVVSMTTKATNVDSETAEYVAFGIDVIGSLLQLPPTSLIAKSGVRRIISWAKRTRPYIRSKLRQKYGNKPQALELLTLWVEYIHKPNSERRASFERFLRSFSTGSELFGMFRDLLQSAGYSTLVVVLDEVTVSTLRGIKAIWDRPVTEKGSLASRLNLVFLLATTNDIYEHAERDQVFCRRLCDTDDGRFNLDGAIVKDDKDANDDFAHAVQAVDSLLKGPAEFLRRKNGEKGLNRARADLASNSPMMWQTLWKKVIDQLVELPN